MRLSVLLRAFDGDGEACGCSMMHTKGVARSTPWLQESLVVFHLRT